MGMVKVPVATTFAMAEPETMPNRPEAIRDTLPGPPTVLPVSFWANLMKVWLPPVLDRTAPKMPNMASMPADRPTIWPQMPLVVW